MKSHPKLFILSLLVFTLAIKATHGQYSVPPNGFCPMGEEVSLDTLFFSSKTSMPFDQCFYLKTSIKGKVKVTYFTIVPVNKKGEIDHKSRDLSIFFKSGWDKPKKEDYPNKEKYKKAKDGYKKIKDKFVGNIRYWKRQPLARLFTDIVSNYNKKNNRTNLVLKIPPLDPHREYKIEFWQRDNASLQKLVDIGDFIFKSHKEEDVYAKNKILLKAERRYLNHPISGLDLKSIGIDGFEDYRNYNSLIDFSFNRDFRYKNIYEYRLLFKNLKTNESFSATDLATAEGPPSLPYTKHKPSKRDPEKAKVIFPAMDIRGDTLKAGVGYKLQVEVLSIGDTTTVVHPNTISFDPIGLLQLSENGTHAVFKPNPLVPETDNNTANYRFFKHYRAIENSLILIDKTLSIHDNHNCFGSLEFGTCCSKIVLDSIDVKLDDLKENVSDVNENVNKEINKLTKEKEEIEKRIKHLKDKILSGSSFSFSFSLKELKSHYRAEKKYDSMLQVRRDSIANLKSDKLDDKLGLLNEISALEDSVSKYQKKVIQSESIILSNESSRLVDKRQFTDIINDLAHERESLNQTKNKLSYQQSIKRKLPKLNDSGNLEDLDKVKRVLTYLKDNCDDISEKEIKDAYGDNKVTEHVILGKVIGYLKLLDDARDSDMQELITCLTNLQQNFKKVRITESAIKYLNGVNSACPKCSNNDTRTDIVTFLENYITKTPDSTSLLNDSKILITKWSKSQKNSKTAKSKKNGNVSDKSSLSQSDSIVQVNIQVLDKWLGYLNSIKKRDSDRGDKLTPVITCFKYLRDRFERMTFQKNRSEDLAKLFEKATECTCGDDNCKCSGVTQDLTKETSLRTTIWVLKEEGHLDKKLEEGLMSFKDIYTEVKKTQHEKRIANLTTNIQYVKELISFAQKSGISQVRDYSTLLKNLKGQVKRMTAVKKELTAIGASQKKLLDSYFDTFRSYGFAYKKTGANNSTSNMDFKARSQFRIVPDFGFVAIGSDFNSSFKVTDFVPYLGFHINFRPINKKIPLRMIRYKNWKHRTSLMFGLTTTSIAIEDKREDLFGSANKSLLTALGFRVNNYFRINAGAVWFRSFDTNPLRGNKPLSASPFVGVSLDLELKDFFGGISSLVK